MRRTSPCFHAYALDTRDSLAYVSRKVSVRIVACADTLNIVAIAPARIIARAAYLELNSNRRPTIYQTTWPYIENAAWLCPVLTHSGAHAHESVHIIYECAYTPTPLIPHTTAFARPRVVYSRVNDRDAHVRS